YTKTWSATVQRADAFVFVMPEYNHTAPPSIVNALNYLSLEWAYKPVGFVSYGGVSGGTRGVESLLSLLATLKLVPMPEAVNIPFFFQYIDRETGSISLGDIQEKAAVAMLDELLRWTEALTVLRR
ncbi:MAG: NAD(P)H-dependent oxidoreductase, partial [Chloroflexota bacterium]